jgi:RNA polymerase sigma factor (sigma-70 family)
MASGRLASIVDRVRGLIRPPVGDAQTDRVLLERFAQHGDQSAFSTLVERHAGMVRGVCRRILGDAAEADDAFQATFLVLVSKRRSVRWRESLAGWLWAVAYRVACKARTRAARRQRHETEAGRMMTDTVHPAEPDDGLNETLHQELARLPEKYRLPLVLCYLQGLTTDEAAAQLGWPRGSVAGRLARARDVLRRRLARRQLAPAPAAIAAALAASAASAPAATVVATVQAASLLMLGNPLTQLGASASAVSLTQGVLTDMFGTKMKIAVGAVLVVLGLGIGVGRWLPADLSPRAEAAPIPGEVARPDATPPPTIRHLEIKTDPKVTDNPGVSIFTTEKEAAAVVGDGIAKQLAEKVDFKKEKVAFVRWSSGGPPFDTLAPEVKKTDDGYVVTFAQKSAVKPGQPRGRALRMGRDYFAVPVAVKVNLPKAIPPGEKVRELDLKRKD